MPENPTKKTNETKPYKKILRKALTATNIQVNK